MKILVDTSVWSEALRRKNKSISSAETFINAMITNEETLCLTGIIVQEILSAIRDEALFHEISDTLSNFQYIEPKYEDYMYAAQLKNQLMKKGVSTGSIDLLIASIAINNNLYLATFDTDFVSIAKHTKLLKILNSENYSLLKI